MVAALHTKQQTKTFHSPLTRFEVVHVVNIQVPAAHVWDIHVESVESRRQRLPHDAGAGHVLVTHGKQGRRLPIHLRTAPGEMEYLPEVYVMQ